MTKRKMGTKTKVPLISKHGAMVDIIFIYCLDLERMHFLLECLVVWLALINEEEDDDNGGGGWEEVVVITSSSTSGDS